MIAQLDGPRLPPASGGKPKQLIVFLHGYGADGNDLIGIGRELARVVPDAAFVAPNAPARCGAGGFGYEWFALTFRDPEERWRGVQQAAPMLDAFLDAELEGQGLQDKDMALVGFSQGTMMALHVGLRRPNPCAAIVGFSGALAGAEHLAEQTTAKPPMLLVHGDLDQVIPVQALHQAREHLGAAGLNVQWHVSEGVPHGIGPDGLTLAAKFLIDAFKM